MDSVRVAMFLSVYFTMLLVCHGQISLENRLSEQEDKIISRDLAEALEGILEGDHNLISLEKKASVIPRCDLGERCAMKHGPRIGRLCDCLRGTACNTFFLRCY